MDIHGFTQSGSIDATIDGIRMTVPDNMANRHRLMIAEWEAAGNTIPPYVPLIEPINEPVSAVDKLKQFLVNNPDVVELLDGSSND